MGKARLYAKRPQKAEKQKRTRNEWIRERKPETSELLSERKDTFDIAKLNVNVGKV